MTRPNQVPPAAKVVKSNPQIILVMGVTGVGKSTFIKHATGYDVEVGHGQASCE
jgi:hypothetical protein